MLRCRIYRTAQTQSPSDYLQIWDEANAETVAPVNSELVFVLEDNNRESMEHFVAKFLER